MPYANGYDNGHAVWDRRKGFSRKPVQIKGEVSIKTIDPEFVKNHNVKVGDIMPWANIKIAE